MKVVFAAKARVQLDEIWDYNARTYGAGHAGEYIEFLLSGIEELAKEGTDGRTVDGFPLLRAKTLKRGRRGHGHVVIYQVDEDAGIVKIWSVFHTRQDVEGRLRRDFS